MRQAIRICHGSRTKPSVTQSCGGINCVSNIVDCVETLASMLYCLLRILTFYTFYCPVKCISLFG